MSGFRPISLRAPSGKWRRWLLFAAVPIVAGVVFLFYQFFAPSASSGRWAYFRALLLDRETFDNFTLKPGLHCGDSVFAFPTAGVVIGLWDQAYRPGHRHQGLDIFPGSEPGLTPVYAAYSGYLTRLDDWDATVIIRIPEDPLQPSRQIWTYYTHMAASRGDSFIAEDFPPGSFEVFVEEGRLLGYQGDYSGDPLNPTGLHLHFSVVKDDGDGNFLNELDIRNTYDPSPYFNLAFNQNENANDIPQCELEISYADWDLVDLSD